MKDLTLLGDPGFALRRSPALTIVFGALGAVAAVALILCLVNYDGLAGNGVVSWRGRSTDALPVIVAPGAVALTALATVTFGWLAVSGATRWRRTSTGTVLRGFELPVAGDAAVAGELHRRFATGDPAVYLPVPVVKRGDIAVRVYRADADRRAFVTVQLGTGAGARTWPLIELSDRGYVQIKRRDAAHFAQPYVPAGGTTDPQLGR